VNELAQYENVGNENPHESFNDDSHSTKFNVFIEISKE
jgi:hypothetical protein